MSLFNYAEAFSRNTGLISPEAQEKLSNIVVCIPGCGGIGSTVSETLARMGVQNFRLADADEFGVGNFNRQIGATMDSVDVNKAEATAARIKQINPEANVTVYKEFITKHNVKEFLKGADFLVDGIDFFHIDDRRNVFKTAYDMGIIAMTTAPMGASGLQHVFFPGDKQTFDDHFGFTDSMPYSEKFLRFFVGLGPVRPTHIPYMDFSTTDPINGRGPSSILGTQQASCLIGGTILDLVAGNGYSNNASSYMLQVDAMAKVAKKTKVTGPLAVMAREFKVFMGRRFLKKAGLWDDLPAVGKRLQSEAAKA